MALGSEVGKNDRLPYLLSAAAVALMALVLNFQGRAWWCKFGDYRIYVNEAWNSSHTSQHLFDPYSLTHILHGVAFFWLAVLILPRAPAAWRFFAAVAAEACWEILENSNYIIQQYRENTASLDYFGDSILNSVGDVAATVIGFWITIKIGWRWSLLFFLLVEATLLLWIRDSLLLNILMLIYPIDWIKAWQSAA